MKTINKKTIEHFDSSVLKNMILLALKSNLSKMSHMLERDYIKYDKDESSYEFLIELFLDEINKVIVTKPLKKYIHKEDDLYYVKGKINVKKTIINYNNKVNCNYDEMSLDNNLNRILKYIVYYLLNDRFICNNESIKKRLLNVYYYLKSVKLVDVKLSDIESIRFDKNSSNYEMLIIICKYILGCIRTDNHNRKYIDIDSMLWWVYQEFIRNYYICNKDKLNIQNVCSSQYNWNLQAIDDSDEALLPNMRTDIEIEKDNEYIIMDAKCYEMSLVKYFDKKMFIPDNLYQLKAYLEAYKSNNSNKKLRGILIYPYNENNKDLNAGKQKFKSLDNSYILEIININFKQNWEDICKELDEIILDK